MAILRKKNYAYAPPVTEPIYLVKSNNTLICINCWDKSLT